MSTHRQTNSQSRSHNCQFRVTNQPEVHVLGLWEEVGAAGEPMQAQAEHAKILTSIRPLHIILNDLLRRVKRHSVWGVGGRVLQWLIAIISLQGLSLVLCSYSGFLPQSENMHARETDYKLPRGCSSANACLSPNGQPWDEWVNWSGCNLCVKKRVEHTALMSGGVIEIGSMSWPALWASLCVAIPPCLFCGTLNGGICPLDTTLTWQRL